MTQYDLASLLEPVTVTEFFDCHYHREYLRIANDYPKFATLMPWQVLNDILCHHRIDPPQLRLVKDGQLIPTESYIRVQRGNTPVPRIMFPEFTTQLRDGATLVIDKVDHMYEPVRSLAAQLERCFGTEVVVNLYAGWRSSQGFDLHWDDHDVFILQVVGKKRWSVFGPTMKYPLKHPVAIGPEREPSRPSGSPMWEGFLNAGDLLYIPRGWWHAAVPCEEPTIHLTAGLTTVTGADLFQWLRERLICDETMRMDLPHFSDARRQREMIARLRELFEAAMQDKEVLKQFYRDLKMCMEPRPVFSLPWSATPEVLPPSGSYVISLASSCPLEIREQLDSGTIEVGFRGRVLTFNDASLPLFEFLETKRSVRIDTIYDTFRDCLKQEDIRVFLSDLIKAGILSLSEPDVE